MYFVLQDLRKVVGAHADDTLTGTDTLEDMVFALREVYLRLANTKLYANPLKCCFGQSEVEYCGWDKTQSKGKVKKEVSFEVGWVRLSCPRHKKDRRNGGDAVSVSKVATHRDRDF